MKIVFFTNRMTSGGSERVISYLANELSDEHEVSILTMTCVKSDYFLENRVKHIPLEDNVAKNNHSLIRNIARIIRMRKYICNNPDAIYISFVTLPSYILLLLRKYIKVGKVIVTVRNDPKASHKHFIDQVLVKWLYPKADAFVFQTKEAEAYYNFIKIKKSIILPNPINEKFIRPKYEGERKKIIVNVGRLIEQKNQRLLINAFSKVLKDYKDYQLYIYGQGYLHDKLQEQIDLLGINKNVKLMGSVSDLQEKIYDVSLFVLSSDFEGMPNALLEAMALGIPVISTKSSGGGPEMILSNKENGLLIPINDESAMVEAINEMLSNPYEAELMARNAQEVVKKYSSENTVRSWEEFLANVYKEIN